jgi:hypothetical protein
MVAKTYYHNVPNSRYIAADGSEHIFKGGQLTTDDPKIQADLDKQIANGNTVIRDKVHAAVDAAALTAKTELTNKAAAAAALAALKNGGAQPPAPTPAVQ